MKTADLRFVPAALAVSLVIACRGGDPPSPSAAKVVATEKTAPAASAAVTAASKGAHSYATHFPLTENPISEGGRWINGGAVGSAGR